MDYTLKSLRSAFEDARIKADRSGYDLYAFLLATTLDTDFVLEYLSYFDELDSLTGSRVLVLGPHLGFPRDRGLGREANRSIGAGQLNGIANVFRHRTDASGGGDGDESNAEQFLLFMQAQTRESYSIARYLSLDTRAMPMLVIFGELDSPFERVEWPLTGKSGWQFVREFRDVLEVVGRECAWDRGERVAMLERQLEAARARSVFEARDAAAQRLKDLKTLLDYYENLAALLRVLDRIEHEGSNRFHLGTVRQTLERLQAGQIDSEGHAHLDAHFRRWKSRMPEEYRTAVRKLQFPWAEMQRLRKAKLAPISAPDALAETLRLEREIGAPGRSADTGQAARIRQLEDELATARSFRSGVSALEVVKRQLSIGARVVSTSSRDLAKVVANRARTVPRVFISYSRESAEHMSRVLEFAQRLRTDGIDCWLDQFEQAPALGFLRWMQREIANAEFVLLVCTATYRRRFDGVEEPGQGHGVIFESSLMLQELYENGAENRKFIPVVFAPATRNDIPLVLRAVPSYEIPSAHDALVKRIFGLNDVRPAPVGQPPTTSPGRED